LSSGVAELAATGYRSALADRVMPFKKERINPARESGGTSGGSITGSVGGIVGSMGGTVGGGIGGTLGKSVTAWIGDLVLITTNCVGGMVGGSDLVGGLVGSAGGSVGGLVGSARPSLCFCDDILGGADRPKKEASRFDSGSSHRRFAFAL